MRSNLKDSQRDALLATLDNPYDKADENPFELTDAVQPEDQPETVIPDSPLEMAGNMVKVMDEMPDVNNVQRKIAYLIAKKKAPQTIAAQCGVSASYVKYLWGDPRIKKLVEIFRGGEIYNIIERISPQEVLDLASVRAAEVLAEKMNAALSEDVQLRAALEVLKLTGHTAKDGEGQVQIVIGEDVLKAYTSARKEVGLAPVEADFEIVQ